MNNDIDFESNQDILKYILDDKNESNTFYRVLDTIKKKVSDRIDQRELSDIVKHYRNFTYDLTWINLKYKELVIEQITEDLINDDIIYYYEKKKIL